MFNVDCWYVPFHHLIQKRQPRAVVAVSLVGLVGPIPGAFCNTTFLSGSVVTGDETSGGSLNSLQSVYVALVVEVPDDTPIFDFRVN